MPLHIVVPGSNDLWDPIHEEFITCKEMHLTLEHSLISLSKWESKYHRPFLEKNDKTLEETIDYIRFMTLTPNVDPTVYCRLDQENIDAINKYIEDPMTASTVRQINSSHSHEKITSELIYYWMIALQIPFECQKWHLNRLMMLIKICNAKNTPPKKMGRNALMQRNASLNAARRKALGTTG